MRWKRSGSAPTGWPNGATWQLRMKLNGLICCAYGLPALSFASGRSTSGLLTVICPSGHAIGKRQRLRCEAQRSAHDAQPRLRDPAAILAGRIAGIEQMAEAVLGPGAVLAVIDAFAQQFRFAVAIAQEEHVTLGGNRQAPQLPLLAWSSGRSCRPRS